jgi:hypothetical protein
MAVKGNVSLKAEVENIASLKGLGGGLIDSIWINDSYFDYWLNAYTQYESTAQDKSGDVGWQAAVNRGML